MDIGIITTARSPGASPRRRRPAAARSMRRHSSPKVTEPSSMTRAGRSGTRAATRRRTERTLWSSALPLIQHVRPQQPARSAVQLARGVAFAEQAVVGEEIALLHSLAMTLVEEGCRDSGPPVLGEHSEGLEVDRVRLAAVAEEPQLGEQAPLSFHGRDGGEAVRIGEEETDVLARRRLREPDQLRIDQAARSGVKGVELLLRDLGVEEVASEEAARQLVDDAQLLAEAL